MAHYERTIDIDAAPADIWRHMSDVTTWPSWTASIPRVEPEGGGWEIKRGARAKVWIKGGLPASWWVVTEVDAGRSFAWESNSGGTKAIGDHVITPTATGARVTLSITITGPFSWIARPFVARVSKRNLEMEAQGLKRISEAEAARAA